MTGVPVRLHGVLRRWIEMVSPEEHGLDRWVTGNLVCCMDFDFPVDGGAAGRVDAEACLHCLAPPGYKHLGGKRVADDRVLHPYIGVLAAKRRRNP